MNSSGTSGRRSAKLCTPPGNMARLARLGKSSYALAKEDCVAGPDGTTGAPIDSKEKNGPQSDVGSFFGFSPMRCGDGATRTVVWAAFSARAGDRNLPPS